MSLQDQLTIATNVDLLLFALLCILAALLVSEPEMRPGPMKPKVEFCKLHSRPIDQCRDQHGD